MNYYTKEMFEFIESQGAIPAKVCADAREFLTEYDKVYLVRENYRWSVTTGSCIRRCYPRDYMRITLFAKDFR